MSAQCLLLAIDLGTTACKVLLLDQDMRVRASAAREYPLTVPAPGWAEQHPEAWWTAVQESVQQVVCGIEADTVRAVGLTGQMHSLVLLDARGEVLRPAILWNDQRSAPQCGEICDRAGGPSGLLGFTGNAMPSGYTGGKLLWVRDHEPEVYRRVRTVLLPKDYLRYRLVGDLGTDPSDASGTGLFDVSKQCWAEGLLARVDLPREWFPEVHASTDVVGTIVPSVAAQTGLRPGTPVIAGGGDAVVQTVGSGTVAEDIVLIVIGTGGNVTVTTAQPAENADAALQVFCHVLPDRWVAMGVTLSAGSALRWFRDSLGGLECARARELHREAYELLCEAAARSPVGANGLVFLPYLQGERCPHPDAHVRGCFVGMGLHTTRADMVRSVMEGVAFSLRDVLERIRRAGLDPHHLRVSGGGAASSLWRQIQADVTGCTVATLDHSEMASAVGAGILAGLSIGCWESVGEATAALRVRTVEEPIHAHACRYESAFRMYQALYPALSPCFSRFASQVLEGSA